MKGCGGLTARHRTGVRLVPLPPSPAPPGFSSMLSLLELSRLASVIQAGAQLVLSCGARFALECEGCGWLRGEL